MKRQVLVYAGAVLLAGCSGGGDTKVATGLVQRADVREIIDAPGAVTARATSTVSAPADAIRWKAASSDVFPERGAPKKTTRRASASARLGVGARGVTAV